MSLPNCCAWAAYTPSIPFFDPQKTASEDIIFSKDFRQKESKIHSRQNLLVHIVSRESQPLNHACSFIQKRNLYCNNGMSVRHSQVSRFKKLSFSCCLYAHHFGF